MDEIVIREATAVDVPQLARLNQFVQQLHIAHAPTYFCTPDLDEVAAEMREQLAQADTWAYLAVVNGAKGETAVGYILLAVQERANSVVSHALRWLHIEQIGVDPAWQGQGIGQRLMETAVSLAQAQNIPEIQLSTWAFNESAQAFFAKLGYQPMLLRYHRRLEP